MNRRRLFAILLTWMMVLSSIMSGLPAHAETTTITSNTNRSLAGLSVTSIKAIKPTNKAGTLYHKTISEEEFNSSIRESGITPFTLENSTEDTGLFRSQLSGLTATFYDGIARSSLNSNTNAVEVRFEYEDGQLFEEIFEEIFNLAEIAMFAYMRDHIEKLYWATNYIEMSFGEDFYGPYVILEYWVGTGYTNDLGSQMISVINSVKNSCTASSRKDKLLYYHDWIVNHAVYNSAAVGNSDCHSEVFYFAHTPAGILTRGTGVCESYAKVFKWFCYNENIPCVLISGSNHMWNYVKMEDGKWYMIDCTFDDPVGNGNQLYHNYFLISNYPNDGRHVHDSAYQYPSTSTIDYNTNHNYVLTKTIAATCKADGSKIYTCSHCNGTYTEIIPKDTTKHSWNSGVITKQATERAEGVKTYTCQLCGTKKTESIPKIQPLFDDVYKDAWYYAPVKWAVDQKITNGTTARTFSPDAVCTRAQIVTFLWNAAGQPKVSGVRNPFTDVKSTDWYYSAVLWAVSKKITNGTTATSFSPNNRCTRGQVVTFLWNWAGQPKTTNTIVFKDVKTTDFYYSAVRWASYKKVTNGTTTTTFSPEDVCTRAQVVTFLYNYYKTK